MPKIQDQTINIQVQRAIGQPSCGSYLGATTWHDQLLITGHRQNGTMPQFISMPKKNCFSPSLSLPVMNRLGINLGAKRGIRRETRNEMIAQLT
jgi:hypothetical protein